MTFADTNVLLDLLGPPGKWQRWSRAQLGTARVESHLVTDTTVVAEMAPSFATLGLLLSFVEKLAVRLVAPSPAAAFRAGQAHRAYRRAGGGREAILADFLIGAHAATLGATLLTRDRQRFATYFPELTLITPETDNG